MLLNLLARADGIVERIELACPANVPLAGRVVPLAARDRDIRQALLEGAAAIDVVRITEKTAAAPDVHLIVGPGDPVEEAMRVHGEAWWGGVSLGSMPGALESALPLGPYAAACLAAAHVFSVVRRHTYSAPESVVYNLASFATHRDPPTGAACGIPALDGVRLNTTLAGVGAVGSTWMHTIWATDGLAVRSSIGAL